MGPTERFSSRADAYSRFRPGYPKSILAWLTKTIRLDPDWLVADIGSGTGRLSELFLHEGFRVIGVEPNQAMRQKAEEMLCGHPHFTSTAGSAEATGLPSKTIDLITVGQAFHWFDHIRAKEEFQRIAKPGGYALLVWNEWDGTSPFQSAWKEMLHRLAIDYDAVRRDMIQRARIAEFFSPHPFQEHTIAHSQSFDLEGLKGRLLSCSFVPPRDHPNYPLIMEELEQLFQRFAVKGQVEFPYECLLFVGKI